MSSAAVTCGPAINSVGFASVMSSLAFHDAAGATLAACSASVIALVRLPFGPGGRRRGAAPP